MHVSDILKEYEKGCSCTIGGKPSDCPSCLDVAVRAIHHYVGMQWNDNMDEVPRDGTEVIVFTPYEGVVSSNYKYGCWQKLMIVQGGNLPPNDPTQWMPLPEPPR